MEWGKTDIRDRGIGCDDGENVVASCSVGARMLKVGLRLVLILAVDVVVASVVLVSMDARMDIVASAVLLLLPMVVMDVIIIMIPSLC